MMKHNTALAEKRDNFLSLFRREKESILSVFGCPKTKSDAIACYDSPKATYITAVKRISGVLT